MYATAVVDSLWTGLHAVQETDILQHLPAFRTFSKNTVAASITFTGAAQLDASQKQAMWTLFKSNMEDFYRRDSQKWNPKEKQRELFHVCFCRLKLCTHQHQSIPEQRALSILPAADA
jgi:hypothetical protein